MESIDGLTEYLKQLERALSCPRRYRKRFLNETRDMAEDFMQGKLGATFEDVKAYLGPPEELAITYLESLPPEEMHQYRARLHNIRYIAVTLTIVSLLFSYSLSFHILNRPKGIQLHDRIVVVYNKEEPT